MIDCVAGYHLNPWTCGIAKFNAILAQQLGLPVVSVLGLQHTRYNRPLVSVKLSEFSGTDLRQLDAWVRQHAGTFDTFFHAIDGGETEDRLIAASRRVLVGNAELVQQLEGRHPDVRELWCPGTILLPQRFEPAEISVFTFGMAHKIRVGYYRKLRDLLETAGRTYKVLVSTALHENTNFDDTFIVRFEELQAIFAGQIYFMGYLSDTAVYNHLMDATFLAAFFDKGLRANNTTVNAAMECGCAVMTNLDAYSPAGYEHGRTILDINQLDVLPSLDEVAAIGRAARDVAHGRYGWDRLIGEIRPSTLA
ncbi:MAG: hypothetical protein AB1806_18025 [Acidobacteriota bacterium]